MSPVLEDVGSRGAWLWLCTLFSEGISIDNIVIVEVDHSPASYRSAECLREPEENPGSCLLAVYKRPAGPSNRELPRSD